MASMKRSPLMDLLQYMAGQCFISYGLTQCFIRTLHKYGFDKDLKSHLRGQGVSETKLETFTRLLMPTEDQGGGAEGCF